MTCLEEFLRGSVFSRKRIQQHSLGLQSCIWGETAKMVVEVKVPWGDLPMSDHAILKL